MKIEKLIIFLCNINVFFLTSGIATVAYYRIGHVDTPDPHVVAGG